MILQNHTWILYPLKLGEKLNVYCFKLQKLGEIYLAIEI